jgi:hypothetical protein
MVDGKEGGQVLEPLVTTPSDQISVLHFCRGGRQAWPPVVTIEK